MDTINELIANNAIIKFDRHEKPILLIDIPHFNVENPVIKNAYAYNHMDLIIDTVFNSFQFKNSSLYLAGDLFSSQADEIKNYDLYIVAKNDNECHNIIKQFMTYMQNSIKSIFVTKSCITITQCKFNDEYEFLNKPIKINYKYYDSPQSIINNFDIPASCFYYDDDLYCTTLAQFAIYSKYNIITQNCDYERLNRYIDKGFGLILPKIADCTIREISIPFMNASYKENYKYVITTQNKTYTDINYDAVEIDTINMLTFKTPFCEEKLCKVYNYNDFMEFWNSDMIMEFKHEIITYKPITIMPKMDDLFKIFEYNDCKIILLKYIDYMYNIISESDFITFYNNICRDKNKTLRKNNKSITITIPFIIEPYIKTDIIDDFYHGYYDNKLQ